MKNYYCGNYAAPNFCKDKNKEAESFCFFVTMKNFNSKRQKNFFFYGSFFS
tara:strand:- start:429 stop:581 length:153 start_codon:yes stop_codon:yes gene_type:complete